MDHVQNMKGETGGYFLLCDDKGDLLFRKVNRVVPWSEVIREFSLRSFDELICFDV
jgi:hypothetical protein